MRTFLVEIGCLIAGVQSTLRYSWSATLGYATRPTDTPANTLYAPRLTGLTFGFDAAGDPLRLGTGRIVLDNDDAALDPILDYVYDGQTAKVFVGDARDAYTDFKELLRFVVEQPNDGDRAISLVVRSPAYNLDRSIQTDRYGGTGGLDGGAELAGKPKSFAWGTITNQKATLVDASKNIYQLYSGHELTPLSVAIGQNAFGVSIASISDQGAALTLGADYTNAADMNANVPAAGQFRTLNATQAGSGNQYGVYVRLGSDAIGDLTWSGFASPVGLGNLTSIVLDILVYAASGTSAEIYGSDRTLAASVFPYTTTLAFGSEGEPATYLDALRQILTGMRGWLVPYQGVPTQWGALGYEPPWAVRWLDTPATATPSPYLNLLLDPAHTVTPYLTIDGTQIMSPLKRRAEYEFGWPEFRTTLLYDRLHFVQTSGLAGSLTPSQRARLALEYLSASDEDLTVKTEFPTAVDRTVTTAWASTTGTIGDEATRQLDVFKQHHPAFDFSARVDLYHGALTVPGDPMDIVAYARHGCDIARTFLILGLSIDFLAYDPNTGTVGADFTVWG